MIVINFCDTGIVVSDFEASEFAKKYLEKNEDKIRSCSEVITINVGTKKLLDELYFLVETMNMDTGMINYKFKGAHIEYTTSSGPRYNKEATEFFNFANRYRKLIGHREGF